MNGLQLNISRRLELAATSGINKASGAKHSLAFAKDGQLGEGRPIGPPPGILLGKFLILLGLRISVTYDKPFRMR